MNEISRDHVCYTSRLLCLGSDRGHLSIGDSSCANALRKSGSVGHIATPHWVSTNVTRSRNVLVAVINIRSELVSASPIHNSNPAPQHNAPQPVNRPSTLLPRTLLTLQPRITNNTMPRPIEHRLHPTPPTRQRRPATSLAAAVFEVDVPADRASPGTLIRW